MASAETPRAPRFAAVLSTLPDTSQAVEAVCNEARRQLAAPAHLALAFFSPSHSLQDDAGRDVLAERLVAGTGAGCLLGCSGESIACGGREIEQEPALALWLAHLPGVSVTPIGLDYDQTAEGGAFTGWPEDMPDPWPSDAALLLLGEPYSFPADVLLSRLNEDRPAARVVGGMASGAYGPGQNRLLLNTATRTRGAVAALIHGDVQIDTVVSQGCRPIGQPYVVTKAERNVILELGGKPPLAQLQALFPTLSPQEQALVQSGLHVGRVINEYQDTFARGDFLIRNVVGVDRESGAIAIGDFLRPGQTVQFHVRDAASADEDLRAMLAAAGSAEGAQGALLFTCNGRGTRLFDTPDHDAAVTQQLLHQAPLAGFFAQGEIGPVGGANFTHGFTASLAIFREKRP